MRILLLEPDKILAASISHQLKKSGHTVDWQVDPQEAIISLDIQPAEAIVMELELAGRSGIEFLYELRSYPDWLNLPVIIYSNLPPREIGEATSGLEHLNIAKYLFKPATPISRLVECLNEVVPTSAK